MTNAQMISVERGTTTPSRWLEPAAFQPVQLLPVSKNLAQAASLKVGAPRQHRAHRLVVAALATAAIAIGGLAATHSTHASAATTASVTVDAASNPNTAANKTITALALGGSPTSSTNSTASLPALGAQN